MFEQIRQCIEAYTTVIIHRHKNPDGDALGSQIGLKHLILANYPDKRVLCVGDAAGRYAFMEDSTMDEVTDEADAAALLRAAGCGVALLASVHAATLSELSVRPACRQLLEAKVFARFVLVENRGGVRRYTAGALP